MKRVYVVGALALLLALSGCSTRGSVATETVDESARDQVETTEQGADAQGAREDAGFQGSELDDPDSLLSQRVIHFEFDSSELSAEDMDILRAHAQYLNSNPNQRIVVEGHTDERGSREYNLALGERRAEAVRRVLTLNGVDAQQVESVSFGEEKPVQYGDSEEAWSQNRRAELVYNR